MAKENSVKWEAELLSAKTRSAVTHIEGAFYESGMRLYSLSKSLQGLGMDCDIELLRHFPVAVIAVLETHFKATVKFIVDAGAPYLERGLLLTKDRMKLVSDFYPIVHREKVTVGDLVSHHVAFNSIASIELAMTTLLDEHIKTLLGKIQDPYEARRDSTVAPIVENIDDLWRTLVLTFEQRHILAHESATKYFVTFEEAEKAIECALIFTQALDAVLYSTIWRNRPLTQYELNMHAADRYRATRLRFSKILHRAYSRAKENGERTIFYNIHHRWQQYARENVAWTGEQFGRGSIRPLVVATDCDRLLKAREADVAAWLSWAEPEGP